MITFKEFLNDAVNSPGTVVLAGKRQTWKTTVASDKGKITKLGVIGVDIGQKRPTGITSRVNEAQLQSIVKSHMKHIGTIDKVFGKDSKDACEMLHCKGTDSAYEFKSSSPESEAALKSLLAHGNRSDDKMHAVKLIGSRKVLAYNGRVITSKDHFDSLVEGLSAMDERDVKNVGRFSHDQAIANGESRDKAEETAKKAMRTRRKTLSK